MQYKEVAGGICAPKGFAAAGVHCGIRANHSEKYDLALIKADVRCAAAGVSIVAKRPEGMAQGIVLAIMVEFYAILCLLASFLMILFLSNMFKA